MLDHTVLSCGILDVWLYCTPFQQCIFCNELGFTCLLPLKRSLASRRGRKRSCSLWCWSGASIASKVDTGTRKCPMSGEKYLDWTSMSHHSACLEVLADIWSCNIRLWFLTRDQLFCLPLVSSAIWCFCMFLTCMPDEAGKERQVTCVGDGIVGDWDLEVECIVCQGSKRRQWIVCSFRLFCIQHSYLYSFLVHLVNQKPLCVFGGNIKFSGSLNEQDTRQSAPMDPELD